MWSPLSPPERLMTQCQTSGKVIYIHIYVCQLDHQKQIFNSSPPSDAYMRQWIGSVLVQIMAWRLFGAKPFSEPMLGYCQLDPKELTSVKFNQNTKIFIDENASENITWEMAAILFRGRWVKSTDHYNLMRTCPIREFGPRSPVYYLIIG